jgi:hypothetical protein
VFEAADIREWRGHDVVDAKRHKIGEQVKGAPSIGTDGDLPAGDEEAIFKHYGLTYEPGADGERRLARR